MGNKPKGNLSMRFWLHTLMYTLWQKVCEHLTVFACWRSHFRCIFCPNLLVRLSIRSLELYLCSFSHKRTSEINQWSSSSQHSSMAVLFVGHLSFSTPAFNFQTMSLQSLLCAQGTGLRVWETVMLQDMKFQNFMPTVWGKTNMSTNIQWWNPFHSHHQASI